MKKGRVAIVKEGVLVMMKKDHRCTLHVHHYCLEIIIPAPYRQKDPFSDVCELSVLIFGVNFFLIQYPFSWQANLDNRFNSFPFLVALSKLIKSFGQIGVSPLE